MSTSLPRVALVWALVPAAACSLLSTSELQEGTTSTGASGVVSSAAASGAGPSTVSGSGGDGGGDGDGDGDGGDAAGGGGSSSVASASTGPGAGGGGGDEPGPPGPCGERSAYADLVLALDPVAYFRMGPDAGSLALDASADPHDAEARGLIESVASPLGALGGCAMHATSLKDAPALLAWTPPDPTLFGDAGAYSLEAWFAIDALPDAGDARFLFARQYADGSRFHLYVTGGGALYWFFDLGGFRQVGHDEANIVPGALHHVVAIRTGPPSPTIEDIYFYFDGRLREGASGAGDDPLDDTDDAPLTMPGEASYGAPADGTFDEIAIYDRVLTQDEVRSHYCAITRDVAICP